jgi:sensor histidine kinase regulating citrate/malate metabolism
MRLAADSRRVELSVRDTGSPVPEDAVAPLFREPVERHGGMGIGLYHVARLARQAGYHLRLAANRPGEVCLALVRER